MSGNQTLVKIVCIQHYDEVYNDNNNSVRTTKFYTIVQDDTSGERFRWDGVWGEAGEEFHALNVHGVVYPNQKEVPVNLLPEAFPYTKEELDRLNLTPY